MKAAGIEARVASPRVLKPGEQRIADFLLRCEAPILVRSAGLVETLRSAGVRLDGDFSLNAANAISASMLLATGLGRMAPTHDLNAAQIAALARGVDPSRLEGSPTTICLCSTPNTASSAGFYPPAPAIATAAGRARNTRSRCVILAVALTR